MDIDKSLDEIIKQRNIGGSKPNRIRTPVKSPGIALVRKNVVPQDARAKLQTLQRARIKDARDRLNQKRLQLDAREKLNRIGAQKVATSGKFQQARQLTTGKRSTSTVQNNPLRRLAAQGVKTSIPGVKNDKKKVVMTKGGLTVISSQPRPIKTAAPNALFARTVDSLTKDAMIKAGLVKTTTNAPTVPKKRQLPYEDDTYEDDLEFASIGNAADLKRLKLPDGTSVGHSKLSPGLQSRLGLGSDGGDPPQGYKVMVSNLHHIVTKQDVMELFGDIGPLKKVQFVEQGVAEVVFVKQADARRAIENYHNRELDGQPMICKLAGQQSVRQESPVIAPSHSGTLRSDHFAGVPSKMRITPDVSTIHSALFNRKTTPRQRPSVLVTM